MLDRFAIAAPGPFVNGAGVYMRPPLVGDWSAWARLRAESREFLKPWEPTWPDDALSRGAYRRRLRHHAREAREASAYAFLIFRRADDQLAGGITLSNVRRGVTQSCSVGYWLGKPFTRRGHMTDALGAIVRHVFADLALHRLEAACLPTNEPSQQVLRSLGFVQEGYARQYLCIDGAWRDHLLFARLASDARPR